MLRAAPLLEPECLEADWREGSDLHSLRTPQSLRSAASSETHIPFRDAASPLSGNTYFSSWSPVVERHTLSREAATSSGRASGRASGLVLPPLLAEQQGKIGMEEDRAETKESIARTAVAYLSARDPRVQMEAFRTLRDLGPLAAEPAASALELALQDGEDRVKFAAMRALSRVVALRASDSLVGTLGSFFDSPSEELRQEAAETLGHVVPKGDERAMSEVTPRLGYDNIWWRRAAATQALAEIAPKGDRRCVDMLVERVADKRHEVRLVAVPALGRVVEMGDARAIAALLRRLEDSVGEVRVAAVRALPRAAPRGDALAVEGASQRLEHPNWLVRLAAVRALAQIAEQGDSRAVEAAGRNLEHPQWSFREDAGRFLPQLAARGDGAALGQVDARLGHEEWKVRQAAVRALGQVAKKGDERAVELLSERLADEDVSVRLAAVRTLPEVALRGDEKAIGAVRTKLQKGTWPVRLAAARAIEKLGGIVGTIPADLPSDGDDPNGEESFALEEYQQTLAEVSQHGAADEE